MPYLPDTHLDHHLNVVKGWIETNPLNFNAPQSANVEFDLLRGRIGHLNAQGEVESGIAGTQMGLIIMRGNRDLDVTNPSTTQSGRFVQQSIRPASSGGNMGMLVCKGSYEVESTEFDDAGNYAPNTLLTAAVDNSDEAVGGVLSDDRAGAGGSSGAVRQYVDACCGVVSRGQFINEHKVPVLAFWPVYMPAAAS